MAKQTFFFLVSFVSLCLSVCADCFGGDPRLCFGCLRLSYCLYVCMANSVKVCQDYLSTGVKLKPGIVALNKANNKKQTHKELKGRVRTVR